MSRERLLDIDPQELKFRFELNKQALCTIKLSNNSRHHVAFKFRTTNPEKYFVRPSAGVLVPGSSLDVQVRMQSPKEAPSELDCRDKFLIQSLVASPGITTEDARKLFSESGHAIEACRLKVVSFYPQLGQSLNPEVSAAGFGDLQVTRQPKRDGFPLGDLFMKGITIGLLGFIFWYLMLPLIWSFVFMAAVLVIKVANKLLFYSVEEWAVRILASVFIQFFTALFQHR